MNIIDVLLITLLILSALSGFQRGLLYSVGRLISLIAGVLVALNYSSALALLLESRFSVSNILAMKLHTAPLALTGWDNPLLRLVMDQSGAQIIGLGIAQVLIWVISFVVLLVVVSIVTNLLWQPLSGLFKHGLIGIINRLAGLALNTAKTALVIALVFFLLFPLLKGLAALNVTAAAAICAYVSESRLFAWLYNNIPRIG